MTASDVSEIKRSIESFDALVRDGDPQARSASWKQLRSRLEEMIEQRAAPHVAQDVRRPLVLVATPEIVSLPENMGNLANMIKTGDGGGLADISAAVTAELYRQGVNVHVALPHYKNLFATLGKVTDERYRALIRGVREVDRIHFVNDVLFQRATRVYDEKSPLDRINLRKAIAFMRGIIYGLLDSLRTMSDDVLIHCNDWMTGLLPAAARGLGVKSLMTFHNIFTEFMPPWRLHRLGIDIQPFQQHLYFKHHPDTMPDPDTHYHENEVDFMASGLLASDYINTVSPTFLRELVRGDFEELDFISDSMRNVIRERDREGRARGILNAPMLLANPQLDPLIYQNYDEESLPMGKQKNKLRFQKQMGLEGRRRDAIFYWPHRLSSPQKGAELVLSVIPAILQRFKHTQFAVVANGQDNLRLAFERLARRFPGKVSYQPFTRELSQLGKAGADFILCPSLYEPCGIPQVEGPRYGTLPIVRKTGGLADTVAPLSDDGESGNGFVFTEFSPYALARAIISAQEFYRRDDRFRHEVLRRAMRESFAKFNATNTVNQYIEVYEEILGKPVRG